MQTSPEVAISSEEESDLNAENQIKVEDKRKEGKEQIISVYFFQVFFDCFCMFSAYLLYLLEVMDGCALEESLLNVNKTDQ